MKKTFAELGTFEDCTFCPTYDPTARVCGIFFHDERMEEFHDGDGVIEGASVRDLASQEDAEALLIQETVDTSPAVLASVQLEK